MSETKRSEGTTPLVAEAVCKAIPKNSNSMMFEVFFSSSRRFMEAHAAAWHVIGMKWSYSATPFQYNHKVLHQH